MAKNRKKAPETEPGELPGYTAWPHERKCPECGKIFCIQVIEDWVYQDGGVPLCSWGCKRALERREEERQERIRANRRNLTPKQREILVSRLMKRGATDEEIQEQLGMSRQHVLYYKKKIYEDWKD